jgi:beta-xylosidase
LGRKTCLAPVSWLKNGWPVVNGNGVVTVEMTCPILPLKPFPLKSARIEFDSDKLGLEWNYIQNPDENNFSLSARKGFLRLKGPEQTINTRSTSTFSFSFRQGNNEFTDVETVDAKFPATETVGFFTGVYAGLYATGNGKPSVANADYDLFEYVVDEK